MQSNLKLIKAVKGKKYDEVKNLVNSGYNLNEVDSIGSTALMYAVLYNDINMIKLLTESGADATISNKEGRTAFFYVKSNEAESLLLESCKDDKPVEVKEEIKEEKVEEVKEEVKEVAKEEKVAPVDKYEKIPKNLIRNYLMVYGVEYPANLINNILDCNSIEELGKEIKKNGTKWINNVDYTNLFKMINKVKNQPNYK